jgi:CheY-like chemotaxis protein
MEETRTRRPPATNCSKDATRAARVETPSLTAYSGLPARRALVVGADSETLQLCRDALESSGFVADAVDSGIAAVVAARASPPYLVLVDVQLRDVPGCEAIGWLRSNPSLQSTPNHCPHHKCRRRRGAGFCPAICLAAETGIARSDPAHNSRSSRGGFPESIGPRESQTSAKS